MYRGSENITVFEDTMARVQKEPFSKAIKESIAAQQYYAENEEIVLQGIKENDIHARVICSRLRSFEAAAKYKGQHIAVLNFASATNPGGGVTRGASAQEECLCRCSTLYPCLNDAKIWDMFYNPHRAAKNPLHNDDCIYTPNVYVIKDDDYNLLEEPFQVDVITCAAPNLRERPTNSYNASDGKAVDISSEELLHLHEKRAERILTLAAINGAEVVILGAFGCGAFKNNPEIVAQAYRNVIPKFVHCFQTIEFAVYCRPKSDANYDAFVKAIYDRRYKMNIYYVEVDDVVLAKLPKKEVDEYMEFYDKKWEEYKIENPDELDNPELWQGYLQIAFRDAEFYITVRPNGYEHDAHVRFIDLENPIWT